MIAPPSPAPCLSHRLQFNQTFLPTAASTLPAVHQQQTSGRTTDNLRQACGCLLTVLHCLEGGVLQSNFRGAASDDQTFDIAGQGQHRRHGYRASSSPAGFTDANTNRDEHRHRTFARRSTLPGGNTGLWRPALSAAAPQQRTHQRRQRRFAPPTITVRNITTPWLVGPQKAGDAPWLTQLGLWARESFGGRLLHQRGPAAAGAEEPPGRIQLKHRQPRLSDAGRALFSTRPDR